MSDLDYLGNDAWSVMPCIYSLDRGLHTFNVLLRDSRSSFDNSSGTTVLHYLFERRLGRALSRSGTSTTIKVADDLRELFHECKRNGVTLATRNRDGKLPLQLPPIDGDYVQAEFDYVSLEKLIASGIVDQEDALAILKFLEPGFTRDCVLGLVHMQGLIREGDNVPGDTQAFYTKRFGCCSHKVYGTPFMLNFLVISLAHSKYRKFVSTCEEFSISFFFFFSVLFLVSWRHSDACRRSKVCSLFKLR
jgi:hypothetical protein